MEDRVARELIALNTAFYAEHADSFSATRSAPWDGWRRVVSTALEMGALDAPRPRVLDLACGNLRFERFLASELAPARPEVDAVDNCPELAAGDGVKGVAFHPVDILGELICRGGGRESEGVADHATGISQGEATGRPAARLPFDAGTCDLAVSFGFMHHVPGCKLRERVLDELIARTRAGGVIAISLWQFMEDERLARKVAVADAAARERAPWNGPDAAQLEPGDHFLGWQADDGALRYCHHFTEAEVDALAAHAAPHAAEVARFSADGSSGALNRYLILRRL